MSHQSGQKHLSDQVSELHAGFGGRLLVRLKDGQHTELVVSGDRVRPLKESGPPFRLLTNRAAFAASATRLGSRRSHSSASRGVFTYLRLAHLLLESL